MTAFFGVPMRRTPFRIWVGTFALLLPGIFYLILWLAGWPTGVFLRIAFVIFAAMTAFCFFVAFDRRVSKCEFLPILNASWMSCCATGLIFGIWTLVIGRLLREPLTMVMAPYMAFYSFGVSIPVVGLSVVIRKCIRPQDVDSFIRCRVCDYRADNVPGPRCLQCGTAIDGSVEVQV